MAAVLSDDIGVRTDTTHAPHRADRVGEPVHPARRGGGFFRGFLILVVLLGLVLVGLVVSGIVTF